MHACLTVDEAVTGIMLLAIAIWALHSGQAINIRTQLSILWQKQGLWTIHIASPHIWCPFLTRRLARTQKCYWPVSVLDVVITGAKQFEGMSSESRTIRSGRHMCYFSRSRVYLIIDPQRRWECNTNGSYGCCYIQFMLLNLSIQSIFRLTVRYVSCPANRSSFQAKFEVPSQQWWVSSTVAYL